MTDYGHPTGFFLKAKDATTLAKFKKAARKEFGDKRGCLEKAGNAAIELYIIDRLED